ncbi:hypothetical protein D1641_12950 [Colidextribacter sp. OB.20]|uniref:hypothetical protein n=1 Tax=Colidextribacter sp. OB.20 TaxID=2304568 RepID=UPI00136DAF6B|nr:hypothetical protein [Colidextribacter sp. OB.20]NBI10911.1 hypothetical protein [Colidextribacter sp. OB.20]
MFTSIVPVLYFSPSIINQIAINNDDGLVVSKSSANKTNLSVSIKALIDKIFIPFSAEGASEYEKSKETQIIKQYDDLFRAIQTVKQVQEEALNGELQAEDNSIGAISFVDGIFKLNTKKSIIDNSFLISVECEFGEYTIQGITSINNWTSMSLINQLLMHGEVTASAIVFPLSIKEKKIQAKIACIFII